MMSPQMAVAAMIIALISLLVISRFGSVGALTMSAEQKVESLVTQGQQKIGGAGAIARSGFQMVTYGVNAILSSGSVPAPTSPPNSNSAQPSPQPSPRSSDDETDDSRRDNRRKRQNQSGGER